MRKLVLAHPKRLKCIHSAVSAFSLAEVLITLGIIGVVSAITIPTLMNSTRDAELKTAWKKQYSEMAQVVSRMAMDNGGNLKGLFTGDSNVTRDLFKPYLSYIKECDAGASNGHCWASSYKRLDGTNPDWGNFSGLILKNGASLMFETNNGLYPNCDWVITPNLSICGYIPVDVNGPNKKPNIVGKDIFSIWLLEDRILPEGTVQDGRDTCKTTESGAGCSAKYLYE